MRKKKLIKALGVISLLFISIKIFNYVDNKKINQEIEKRFFLYEISNQNNWNIIKVTNSKIVSPYNDDSAFPNPNALNHESSTFWGPIFYDSIRKNIWIKTTELNTSLPSEVDSKWVCFDEKGKIINQNKADLRKIPAKPIPGIGVEETNIETKSRFYIEKYIMEKKNWSSFNPLRNMGRPNGSSENIYSEGIAFINLNLGIDTIKFKTQASKGEFGLHTDVTLFANNLKNLSENQFLLIDFDKDLGKNGLYILFKK